VRVRPFPLLCQPSSFFSPETLQSRHEQRDLIYSFHPHCGVDVSRAYFLQFVFFGFGLLLKHGPGNKRLLRRPKRNAQRKPSFARPFILYVFLLPLLFPQVGFASLFNIREDLRLVRAFPISSHPASICFLLLIFFWILPSFICHFGPLLSRGFLPRIPIKTPQVPWCGRQRFF